MQNKADLNYNGKIHGEDVSIIANQFGYESGR